MRYVIIYINDIMIQGHCIYCLVSIVNALLQWKVQRVTPTYLMQVSTVVLYYSRGLISLGVNFIDIGICWNFRLNSE